MKSFNQLARAAYEAQRQELIRIAPYAAPMPWAKLKPDVQALWVVVAKKVAEEIAAIH